MYKSLGFFIILGMMCLLLSGCATDGALVLTKHILVAQDDDQLVDCTISQPPDKADYLNKIIVPPGTDEIGVLKYAIKDAEERERKLTAAWREQTANIITCNVRWKGARVFKVMSTERIKALDSQKGK